MVRGAPEGTTGSDITGACQGRWGCRNQPGEHREAPASGRINTHSYQESHPLARPPPRPACQCRCGEPRARGALEPVFGSFPLPGRGSPGPQPPAGWQTGSEVSLRAQKTTQLCVTATFWKPLSAKLVGQPLGPAVSETANFPARLTLMTRQTALSPKEKEVNREGEGNGSVVQSGLACGRPGPPLPKVQSPIQHVHVTCLLCSAWDRVIGMRP